MRIFLLRYGAMIRFTNGSTVGDKEIVSCEPARMLICSA